MIEKLSKMKTIVQVKHIKQSASKVRYILNTLRGSNVENAISKLSLSNKKASTFIYKAIMSGISNLSNENSDVNQNKLFITEAFVNEGPSMKRFRPRAMGRASSIIKRSCHLTLTLEQKGK